MQVLDKIFALCHTVKDGKAVERVYRLRCTAKGAELMNTFGRRIDRVCKAVSVAHELHKNGGQRSTRAELEHARL